MAGSVVNYRSILQGFLCCILAGTSLGSILVNEEFTSFCTVTVGDPEIDCGTSLWTRDNTASTGPDILLVELDGNPLTTTRALRLRNQHSASFTLDTRGFTDIEISYAAAHRFLKTNEFCVLQYDIGSGFLTERAFRPSAECDANDECPTFALFVDSLSGADELEDLVISFKSNSGSLVRYCLIDDVVVTGVPTPAPTTFAPTDVPSESPSKSPTTTPTKAPTDSPTVAPSKSPTASPVPTGTPTLAPSKSPTASPVPITSAPTDAPNDPTDAPTEKKQEPQDILMTALLAVVSGVGAFALIMFFGRGGRKGLVRNSEDGSGALASDGYVDATFVEEELESLGAGRVNPGGESIGGTGIVTAVIAPPPLAKKKENQGRAAKFGEYIPKRKRKMLQEVEEEFSTTTTNPLYDEGEKKGEKENDGEEETTVNVKEEKNEDGKETEAEGGKEDEEELTGKAKEEESVGGKETVEEENKKEEEQTEGVNEKEKSKGEDGEDDAKSFF